MFEEKIHTEMDGLQMVPLWISALFPDDVWKYGFPDMAGCKRSTKSERNSEVILDI